MVIIVKGAFNSVNKRGTVNSFLFREKESAICQGCWGGSLRVCAWLFCVPVVVLWVLLQSAILWLSLKTLGEEEGLAGLFSGVL